MNFFNKILSVLKGSTSEKKEDSEDVSELSNQEALEVKFAKEYTSSGGFFHFCKDERNALSFLKTILEVEDVYEIYCPDEELISFLDVLQANHVQTKTKSTDCSLLSCNSLIAHDGRIVFTEKDLGHTRVPDLPRKVVIMATTDQIVDSIATAMIQVKRTNPKAQMSSISGPKLGIELCQESSYKIFLLLIDHSI